MIPRYLEAFDPKYFYRKKYCESKIIRNGSYLHEEPDNLLKAELKRNQMSTAVFYLAIANGRNKIIDIANFIHEDRTKVCKIFNHITNTSINRKKNSLRRSLKQAKNQYIL